MAEGESRRNVRLQLLVSEEMLALIEDFCIRTRMPSQSAAVRELLRRGLASDDKKSGRS
jgi:ribbon-helix-helix CopG family protein